jgi:glycosyltransferase involved in cell wall biosynthesis
MIFSGLFLGGRSGTLPPFDAQTFADHIDLLIHDKYQYQTQRELGLKRAQDFNWRNSAQRILDIIISAKR